MQCRVWEGKVTPERFEDTMSKGALEAELEEQSEKEDVSREWSFMGTAVGDSFLCVPIAEAQIQANITFYQDY